MNPRGSEKTERGSKRTEGNEASRVRSILLPEGGGALRDMGEKVAAHPLTGIGSVTAHNRSTSLICHGMKNILRAALAGESTARRKLSPKDNRFNPRQA
jgi:hypothetical protein